MKRDEKDVERELAERATEEKRQWSGSTPTEDVMERALSSEEDGAERKEEGDENDVPHTGANPT